MPRSLRGFFLPAVISAKAVCNFFPWQQHLSIVLHFVCKFSGSIFFHRRERRDHREIHRVLLKASLWSSVTPVLKSFLFFRHCLRSSVFKIQYWNWHEVFILSSRVLLLNFAIFAVKREIPAFAGMTVNKKNSVSLYSLDSFGWTPRLRSFLFLAATPIFIWNSSMINQCHTIPSDGIFSTLPQCLQLLASFSWR